MMEKPSSVVAVFGTLASTGHPAHRPNPKEPVMRLHSVLPACLLALSAVPSMALADPGAMMHVTSVVKVQMPGMAMNMPPHSDTMDVCVPKHHDVRDVMNHSRHHQECSISAFNLSPSGGGFHYSCGGEMPMSGDAHFTQNADGGSHVTLNMAGNAHGQAMAMDMTVDSTPTGAACNYAPPAQR